MPPIGCRSLEFIPREDFLHGRSAVSGPGLFAAWPTPRAARAPIRAGAGGVRSGAYTYRGRPERRRLIAKLGLRPTRPPNSLRRTEKFRTGFGEFRERRLFAIFPRWVEKF